MDDHRLTLPEGLEARPLAAGDAQAVTDVVAACELADDDATTMSLGVFDAIRLVAFGEVFMGKAEVEVIPPYRGRGMGSALMRWSWDVARADGRDVVFETGALGLYEHVGMTVQSSYTSYAL